MKKRLGLLVAGTLGTWLLAVYPAHALGGEPAVVYSLVAVALCLLPTSGTLLWAGWALDQTTEQQLALLLGGMGVRMAFVLGGGLILYSTLPYFQQPAFWLWVLVFYLLTLTLEMVLILKDRPVESER